MQSSHNSKWENILWPCFTCKGAIGDAMLHVIVFQMQSRRAFISLFVLKKRVFFHDDCNPIMYASLLVRTTWNYLTCCLACSKLLFTNFSSMTKTYSSAVLRRFLQKHIWTNVHQNISFIGKHILNHLPHVCHEPCPDCIFRLLKQIMKNHVFCGWYAAWWCYEHQIVFCPALHEWFFFSPWEVPNVISQCERICTLPRWSM